MKTTAIVLCLFMSFYFVNAQEIKQGEYYPNSENKKFEGSWIYANGSTTFKVVFESKKMFIEKVGIYTDCLVGKYYFVNNGKEIANYIDSNKTPISFGISSPNGYTLEANFDDNSKKKLGRLTLELLPNKVQKIKWTLVNTEGVSINGKGKEKDFSVPTNLILSKAQ